MGNPTSNQTVNQIPHLSIDINCDLGEGKDLADCEHDASLMPYIHRCNIACGGHAGDVMTMKQSLKNAKRLGILAGAHPGYEDQPNFGRVSIDQSFSQTLHQIINQIKTLEGYAAEQAIKLDHIKLHGALYNDAEKNPELAEAICLVLAEQFPHLKIVGLANGQMQIAAERLGLSFLREAFMDRAYLTNGQLAPRTLTGSVYSKTHDCIHQVLQILKGEPILTLATQSHPSEALIIEADTYCLHGDGENALALAKALKQQITHYQNSLLC